MFTISTLGSNGRFGNQIGVFLFGKALARKFNCPLQVPEEWLGRKIFTIPEGPIEYILPTTPLDYIPGESGWDLFGYYQYQRALDLYSKKDVFNWLQIKPEWMDIVNKEFPYPGEYVCFHRRHGDYLKLADQGLLCVPTLESYTNSLKESPHAGKQVVIVSEESPHKSSLPSDISFLMDFVICMRASALWRGNSTFSFWAHVLRTAQGQEQDVYAPNVHKKIGICNVKFEKGNHPCMVSFPQWNQGDLWLK